MGGQARAILIEGTQLVRAGAGTSTAFPASPPPALGRTLTCAAS